jgi:secreted trypsin-like serine protease
MRVAVVALVSLFPLVANADPGAKPVIGGTDAPLGKWPDVAAVYTTDGLECTGTLIAPTVVITAGHCVDPMFPFTNVLIGTNSLINRQAGETINITRFVEYPDSQTTFDVAILILERASTREPRKLASGWAGLEIKNGADTSIAGYGAIDRMAMMYVNELKEATVKITDADCSKLPASAGCSLAAKPNGELAAGGVGMPDTCPGDSGGPLYLATEFGTFLAGVTSRGYDDNVYDCSEGGIYVRPGRISNWIAKAAGTEIALGPEPSVPDKLTAVRGHAADVEIDHNDPKSEKHTFAITKQPKFGKAAVHDDGHLRVCTDPGVTGMDSLELSITDKNDPTRKLEYVIAVETTDGDAADSCDVDDFDSGGCCDSGRSAGGSLPLGIGVLLVLRRRRR